ncbi:acyltransferase [Vibrio sp. WJH972]
MNIRFLIKILPKISIIKSVYYSFKFRGKIIIGKNCRLYLKKDAKISFANNYSSLYLGIHFNRIEGTILDLHENSVLHVGKSVGIHRGSKVVVRKNAVLSIGDNTFFNENCRVQCGKKISIGESTSIGWNCNILDSDLHGIYIDDKLSNMDSPIVIGSNVWIGANSIVLKGADLSDNTILGISSVFKSKSSDSGYIYAGNPAVKIKKFDKWGVM